MGGRPAGPRLRRHRIPACSGRRSPHRGGRAEHARATRPIALRNATKFSVILGVFSSEELASTVTLAQVFWMKNGDAAGQPDRSYVTAGVPLAIATDFLGFGQDMAKLRKRLKATSGVELRDGFPEYGRDFRRLLGIESEQAMELFHQTVSMNCSSTTPYAWPGVRTRRALT